MTERTRGAYALARVGKTQAEIAKQLKVSTGIVAMWLKGQRKPADTNRRVMFSAYGIAVEAWDEASKEPFTPAPELLSNLKAKQAAAPVAAPVAAVPAPPPGLSQIEQLEFLVDQSIAQCTTDVMTPQERGKTMKELTLTLDRIRKMRDLEAADILASPEWAEIRDATLEELRGDPAALKRVVDRLAALD